ncbi:MAG: NADP-dependent malic enzyme [Burkholderiales bacterium]|nr:NADP-dependent malic enzyme [Burkholderiales bacterium]
MNEQLRKNALEYHRLPIPGKIAVVPSKGLTNQRDLGLAYTPGVAAVCEAIVDNPEEAFNLTARGNLVAVITNGTAVLGLGAIGPLAAKPVMEGKGVLFKKFAGIDVFDIEIDERDPQKLVDIIASLEPTFGGINLEDIKAPECFEVERKLKERMKIPVFHDDQHGTSIIVGAAVLNGLRVVGKAIASVKLVVSGAGAAALACLDMLVSLGLSKENIYVTDIKGVVFEGRVEEMDPNKARYARKTDARSLMDVISGADIFLGLSAGGVLKAEMVQKMAENPLILALANPEPEIHPAAAKKARPDAVIATGRSDYPNQVNNALCFPFIFRGALDVGATSINEEMKKAAVFAIAGLAHAEQSETAAMAYGGDMLTFGRDYLIPKPFDPRLIMKIAPAVAKAAMESGVATRPIHDFDAYRERISRFVYQSAFVMKPVFAAAKSCLKRVIYAEGEDDRVLQAAQVVVDEGLARPVLAGRTDVIESNIARLGLRIRTHVDFDIVHPGEHATECAARMLKDGSVDAMLCGIQGEYAWHLDRIEKLIGLRSGVNGYAAMNLLILAEGNLFICDTYVNTDPDARQIAEMTLLAADQVRRFGMTPKVALLSHSNFGSSDTPSPRKMRQALEMVRSIAPDLEIEGEMHSDAALSEEIRYRHFHASKLKGEANLLIMPNLDAANIAFNLLKMESGGGITVGPLLLGAAKPVHILTPTATVRRIVNMTALAAA